MPYASGFLLCLLFGKHGCGQLWQNPRCQRWAPEWEAIRVSEVKAEESSVAPLLDTVVLGGHLV